MPQIPCVVIRCLSEHMLLQLLPVEVRCYIEVHYHVVVFARTYTCTMHTCAPKYLTADGVRTNGVITEVLQFPIIKCHGKLYGICCKMCGELQRHAISLVWGFDHTFTSPTIISEQHLDFLFEYLTRGVEFKVCC